MRRPILLILATLGTAAAAPAAESPAAPSVETTLATRSRSIRQFAFDGDPVTFFASAANPRASDHFTLDLGRPVPLGSVSVVTGLPDGSERSEAGVLEVSVDGKVFEEVAKFSGGSARADTKGRSVVAVRIRPTSDMDHALAIREIVLESAEPVPTFRYPVEFAVDIADAPEMKDWADKAARNSERWYPRICEAFRTDGDKPISFIVMVITPKYDGVAMAGGGKITGSAKYFKDHPNDLGAMIHETVHVVQHYRGRNNPGWLVEGVADYFRFFIYEPGKAGPVNPKRAHYNDSYRTTATFLAYLTDKYDKEIVPKLNRLMREGKYKEEVFREFTGKSVGELGEEWLASIRK